MEKTLCKDFRCEKGDTCLYHCVLDDDCRGYEIPCCYRNCDYCKIRQTCSAYIENIKRQQKIRKLLSKKPTNKPTKK